MKENKRNLLDVATKRFGIGAITGFAGSHMMLLISMIGRTSVTVDVKGYITMTVLTSLIAGYLMAASVIYELRTVSLRKRTSLHLAMMLAYFPVAYKLGWMPRATNGLMIYILVWLLIYAVAWFILKNIFERKTA